jgi:DNA-directed RNA polymerase specialized sigma24 family protein
MKTTTVTTLMLVLIMSLTDFAHAQKVPPFFRGKPEVTTRSARPIELRAENPFEYRSADQRLQFRPRTIDVERADDELNQLAQSKDWQFAQKMFREFCFDTAASDSAFEVIKRSYTNELRRYASAKVPYDAVDEVMDDTWQRFAKQREKADCVVPDKPAAWLTGIMTHAIADYHRRESSRKTLEANYVEQTDYAEEYFSLNRFDNPIYEVAAIQMKECLDRKLAPKQIPSAVGIMHMAGQSLGTIAKLTQNPKATVDSWMPHVRIAIEQCKENPLIARAR